MASLNIGSRVNVPHHEGAQGVIVNRHSSVRDDVVVLRHVASDGTVIDQTYGARVVEEHNPPPVDVAALHRAIADLRKTVQDRDGQLLRMRTPAARKVKRAKSRKRR